MSKGNKDNKEKEKTAKLNYKQYIIIILLTTFGIMFSLGFSFSIFDINANPEKDSFINNILAAIKRDDDDDDDDDDKPNNKLIFSYYEKPGVGNGIKLYNQFPIRDEIGREFQGDNYVFDFVLLLGEDSKGITYDIVAERSINSNLRNEAVKIYLESDGEVVGSVIRDTGRIKTFNEFPNYSSRNLNERKIYSGKVSKAEAKRGYKSFTFKMWISEDLKMTQEDLNKTFISYINVYARGKL